MNIKILATEMFKVSKNLAHPQMHDIFKLKDQSHCNLRYNSLFSRPPVKSVYKGTESLLLLGPKIWDILPDTYKHMPDLISFKIALKKWSPVNYPCSFCKIYIANVGFVEKLKLNLSYLDELKKKIFVNVNITLIYR